MYIPNFPVIMNGKVMSGEKSPTEKFICDMTYQMFSEFYHAMQARLHTDETLNRFVTSNIRPFLSEDEISFVSNNDKIKAIKSLRQRTGLSLKEAKDTVDNWHENYLRGIAFPAIPAV